MTNPVADRTPTTVFSGFLGSGKTTIIGHLIDELQQRGEQVVYIKNEIGDTDLDAKLLQGKHIQTRELLNGCICCTLVGPFHASITEMIEQYHPSRILIEASGAADLAALALMISSHPLLSRDGVISIIDVLNFEGYKDLSITAQNQTTFTDLLIFNKIELADTARKQAVVGYVRELNSHSPIIEAPLGVAPIDIVFGIHNQALEKLLLEQSHESTHDHVIVDNIQTLKLTPNQPLTNEQLQAWIDQLPKNVFRVKGLVRSPEGLMQVVNAVGGRLTTALAPDHLQSATPVLIVIGFQVASLQASLEESLLVQ